MDLKFHHICIETFYYIESIDFYTRILGFSIVKESKDFHGRKFNTWIKNDEIVIELQTPKRTEEKRELGNIGIMHICFSVKDLRAFIENIKEKGFKDFLPGKRNYKVKGCELSKILAPEGTIIELRE